MYKCARPQKQGPSSTVQRTQPSSYGRPGQKGPDLNGKTFGPPAHSNTVQRTQSSSYGRPGQKGPDLNGNTFGPLAHKLESPSRDCLSQA